MPAAPASTVAAVRRFSRFYTRRLGLLKPELLDSGLTLTESRLLYELAQAAPQTASVLARRLELDPGHLSRLLAGFMRRGWLARQRSSTDARAHALSLTPRGRAAFVPLDRASRQQVAAMVGTLTPAQAAQLEGALGAAERWLAEPGAGPARDPASFTLRPHKSGDIGWVVSRHGSLYAEEYGFDLTFEALVAEVAAGFVRHFDARFERCWIAERDSQIAGSVFLVRKSGRGTRSGQSRAAAAPPRVAQLRLLYLEPWARGCGLGRRLVDECIAFARQAGYREVVLWTQSNLDAARHIYLAAGFRRVREEPHRSFGCELVGEYWALSL